MARMKVPLDYIPSSFEWTVVPAEPFFYGRLLSFQKRERERDVGCTSLTDYHPLSLSPFLPAVATIITTTSTEDSRVNGTELPTIQDSPRSGRKSYQFRALVRDTIGLDGMISWWFLEPTKTSDFD